MDQLCWERVFGLSPLLINLLLFRRPLHLIIYEFSRFALGELSRKAAAIETKFALLGVSCRF
jgi:hypothetical protein